MIKPTKEVSLLDMTNGTVLEIQVYKAHAGVVQIIAVAQDGSYKPLQDWQLYGQPLIDQNMQGDKLAALPKDWPTDHHLKNPSLPYKAIKILRVAQ